jgi:NUMOD4 motif/HNH endonuclease
VTNTHPRNRNFDIFSKIKMEIWRLIPAALPGDEKGRTRSGLSGEIVGRYAVSNLGRVKHLSDGEIVSQRLDQDGYFRAWIGKSLFKVHRLVAFAFVPGDRRLGTDHRDGNRQNNISSNLRWATAKENNDASREAGRWSASRHVRRKVTEEQVVEIRRLAAIDRSPAAIAALANRFGMKPDGVRSIVYRKVWRHLPSPPLSARAKSPEKTKVPSRWNAFLHARNNVKLNDSQVIEIRRLGALDHSGQALMRLAEKFGVLPGTIHAIIFGRCWKHLPLAVPQKLKRGRRAAA